MDIKNKIFSNYAVLVGKKSDFNKAVKILLRNKIVCEVIKDKFYANSTTQTNVQSIKDFKCPIQEPDFTSMSVHWSESESNPLVTKILLDHGFGFYYLGEDGSWLATPFYILVHKSSLSEIKDLAKKGYFSQIKGGLWNLT